MKIIRLMAVLSLLAGCAGNGPYGRDNPNAGANVAATGAGAAVLYGMLGIAVFASAVSAGS